jgi:CDGSH-type Zn-finger protein
MMIWLNVAFVGSLIKTGYMLGEIRLLLNVMVNMNEEIHMKYRWYKCICGNSWMVKYKYEEVIDTDVAICKCGRTYSKRTPVYEMEGGDIERGSIYNKALTKQGHE